MSQHRRPRTRIGRALNAWWVWPAIVGLILGYALYGASDARADGQLDRSEADYVLVYGYTVCAVIDQYPNVGGVLGVVQAIVADGFAQDSAADIINQSVLDDCPRHWPLLQAIGRVARGQTA